MIMESNNEIKEIKIKNLMCYYFDEIMKIEDFNLDNILKDEKTYKNILVYNISYKPLIDAKPLQFALDKKMESLEFIVEIDI